MLTVMMIETLLSKCMIDMFTVTTNAMKRICYFDNWAQWRSDNAKHTYANIDPSLCSHIVFAFVGMNGNDLEAIEYNDEDSATHKGVYVSNRCKCNVILRNVINTT